MASLYKRKNSPYWWIKYKDAAGKPRQESTGYRYAVPAQTKKARILRNEKHLLELKREKGSEHGAWSAWVEKYLDRQYETQQKTLRRYKTCWRHLSAYLDERRISAPHQLTFDDCADYMDWRKAGQPHLGIYRCGHNTARLDLKILHLICERAIKRGLIVANPCRKLGIKRHKSPEKPELTDDDIARDIPDTVRVAVLDRDEHRCVNCDWSFGKKTPSDPRTSLELHHIQHHADRGENSAENLITLCNVCHDDIHRKNPRQ